MLGGYFFNKFKIFPNQTPQVLNKFIIYVSLPAMVLLYVPKIEFNINILIPFFISWIVTIFGFITIYFLSKQFNFNKQTTAALMLVAVLGNTSFLGIPIVTYYYGTSALPYVMIYDQLGSFLALSTYGTIIVALYSSSSKAINFKTVIKKIIYFPPFISLIIAFLFLGVEFSNTTIKILTQLANTLVPVALISVGFSLQLKIPKHDIKPFAIALTTKLIIIPIYAILVVYLFNFDGLIAKTSILESAMGPMITAGILASMSGFNEKLTSSIIGYGVVISFFSTALIVEVIKILNI